MNDIPGTAPEDEDNGAHAEAAPLQPVSETPAASPAPQDEPAAAAEDPSGAQVAEPQAAGSRFADVVSGRFDSDEEVADLAPPKRVLLPQPETPKLHKILAQAGLGSRLEMEQLITEGRISVNNEPAHIGQRIQYGDQVKVNGKPIRFRIDAPPPRVIAYHKPTGEVVTHDDPQNRPTVFRKLPKLFQGKWQSVGRLDLNTEGLLLFTNSGELANKLMHPRFGLEREYAVRVLGALSNEEKQRLLDGVNLDDGQAQFGSIEDGGGEGSNCWYRVTISEGRNREVRRMFEAVGHAVSRLIRIRYGAMLLPRGLKRGASLELDMRDIQALMHAAGARAPQPPAPRGAGARGQPDRRGGGRNTRGGQGQGQQRHAQGQGQGGQGHGEGGEGGAPMPPRGNAGGRNQRGGRGSANLGNAGNAGNAGARRDGGNRSEGPIPNPLTVSTPGGQRRNPRDGGGGGGGGGGGSGAQPDPMKTSFGYIGADSFTRQRQGQQRRGGGGNGGGGGGGGPQRRGGRGR